jgi:hypothetical protein
VPAPERLFEIARRNPVARFAYRARVVLGTRGALRRAPRESLRFIARGRQLSNFYYELGNLDEIVGIVASALEAERATIEAHLRELENDRELRAMLAAKLTAHPYREREPRYGYRRILYAIARIARPGVVAEVGTHDGLGAAVLARALQRNGADGAPGCLLTFDLSDEAGWLLDGELARLATRYVGDIHETLPKALAEHGVDFLIEDIGSGYEDRRFLFDTAVRFAGGPRLIIRSEVDDTTELAEITDREGGRLLTFRERPVDHFWPGHVNGLAVIEPGIDGEPRSSE